MMADLETLADDILDDHGYPTDEALALIPAWTGTPRGLVTDLLAPILAVYGTVGVTERVQDDVTGRRVVKVHLSTGGWSGCEDAIGALKKGAFWRLWWVESRRGGGYSFEIPADTYDEPMIEWPVIPDAYDRGFAHAAQVTRSDIDTIRAMSGLPAEVAVLLGRLDATLLAGPQDR